MGGINLYGFVANNPINFYDPYGLSLFSDFGDWELGVAHKAKEFFTGNPCDYHLDPNSLQYLSNQAGVGVTPLTDQNGNQVDAADLALEVFATPLIALTTGGLGEVGELGAAGEIGSGARLAATDGTEAAQASDNAINLALRYKSGWTDVQRAAADAKVEALSKADTVVTANPIRSGTSAATRYRQAGGTVQPGQDVDHIVDLQLGGSDSVINMSPLDSSVNRSLGAQIQQAIKNVPAGTKVNNVTIGH